MNNTALRYRRVRPSDAVRTRMRRRHSTHRRGWSSLMPVMILTLLFGAGLLYVAQINYTATGALTIRQLEGRMDELKSKNQELELKADAIRSLSAVEYTSTQLQLITQVPADFLPSVSSTVALAK